MSARPEFFAGRLPTLNNDPYPSLGEWWVQIWDSDGERVVARAYGDSPDEARAMAARIVSALTTEAKG